VQQDWIEIWVKRIRTMGLSSAALSLLDTVRAFGFLGGQALLMTQPLVSGFADNRGLERAIALLDNPELLDQLGVALEGDEVRE